MNNIDNEIDITLRKSSIIKSTIEVRSRANSTADIIAVDFLTSLSSIVPSTIDENDEDIPLFSNQKIHKNLIILSVAFVLLFTAYSGIASLQSSLNTEGNVGVNSLIVTNAVILFSSIFLTSISMDIFGLKWTIIVGELGYISYTVANIRPRPVFMYISAACLGLASAPLWASQAVYIGCLARYHAHHQQKKVDVIVSLFFGIFFAFIGTCTIWGNLISYFVLNQSNQAQKFNCGIHFDPLSRTETNQSGDVSDETRYVLCGIFTGTSVISVILLVFFLDQIRISKSQSVRQSLKKSLDVLQSLFRWRHIDQLFLMPLTVWTMVESTFLVAQFTRAFITCLVGIRFIGLVLICNGVCNTLCSYVFGSLVKCIGRLGCFIIAAIINYAMIILMYLWEPVEDQMWILFVIAGLWGVASAAWQSQVIAAYTVLYADTDSSAIAKYRLWKSVGSLITYGYASYVDIEKTLIVLFTILTVSMIFYGMVEIHIRWKNQTKKSNGVNDDC